MTGHRLRDLVRLEGRRVGISLTDGSRIDDCQLVFAGQDRVWVFVNGRDTFVSATRVSDFWES
jgi:hypothetical protein